MMRSHPDIKVVAVTVCEEDPFPTRLLQAGAAGYMTSGAGLPKWFRLFAWCLPGSAISFASGSATGAQVFPACQ